MNRWVERSIRIANAAGYLDKLHRIYPVTIGNARIIPDATKRELERAYRSGDRIGLLRLLLRLKKFPIKDPYVAFLRKNPDAIRGNPQTAKRIVQRIRAIGFSKMFEGITEAKEFNRQIGPLFKRWLHRSFVHLPADRLKTARRVALLDATDAGLLHFANQELGCRLRKSPDFVGKTSHGRYIVGEAKFLTAHGGHQGGQFSDAMRLVSGRAGRAIRVAVLDGIVWIPGKTRMHRTVVVKDLPIFSALFLRLFLRSN